MGLIQPVVFLALACLGSLILADTVVLWRDFGSATRILLGQYAGGGVCWLAIGAWGLVTDASLITPIPGPWAEHEATELVSTLGLVAMLVQLGLVGPPKRHLDFDRSPAIETFRDRHCRGRNR